MDIEELLKRADEAPFHRWAYDRKDCPGCLAILEIVRDLAAALREKTSDRDLAVALYETTAKERDQLRARKEGKGEEG